MIINAIFKEIESNASEKYAQFYRKMTKSEQGHGKGDLILGCSVPNLRKIAKKYYFTISLEDLLKLLRSKYHEARTLALIIMVYKFKSQDENLQKRIVRMYLDNTEFINSWDLVDVSSYHIIGSYFTPSDPIFEQLSDSNDLWENRIAIVSTYSFIKQNHFDLTLQLCWKFMKHEHHLIHKACGWMLREIGKKNEDVLVNFLRENHKNMPRIMLSYARERLKNVQI